MKAVITMHKYLGISYPVKHDMQKQAAGWMEVWPFLV